MLRVRQHLARVAGLDHHAVVHEDERVTDLAGEAHLVGDDDHRHAVLSEVPHHVQDLADQLRVEGRGRLVEEHQLRVHGQRAGDGHALLLTAGELRGEAARLVGETTADAILYRANFSARELMLLYPDFLAFDTASATNIASFAAARAMGLRARIDEEVGPHKTLSNYEVQGVVGLTKDIYWDIEDASSEAGQLNAKEITALIRTDSGYRFWGNRTTAPAESQFVFESTTRVAQLIADTVVNGMIWAIDKPITPALARDIVETINGFFLQLKAAGVILGANARFDEAGNSTASLKAGKLRIDYDFTVPPPLEELGFNQRITDSYFADFASLLTGNA